MGLYTYIYYEGYIVYFFINYVYFTVKIKLLLSLNEHATVLKDNM